MRFNPDKCCILRTTGGIKSQRFYHMKGHILKQESQVKYLGVTFSDNLKWGPHIQSVIKKANQKLGFIRRNLRGAPLQTKQTAYFSLVRSGMEYAAPIWDPHQVGDTQALDKIQRLAARWVKSNYERKPGVVTRLLRELDWPPLADRRRNLKLILLFKLRSDDIRLSFEDFGISLAERVTKAASVIEEDSTITSFKLDPLNANKSPLLHSTIVSTIPLWNKLPGDILALSTSDSFKSALANRAP